MVQSDRNWKENWTVKEGNNRNGVVGKGPVGKYLLHGEPAECKRAEKGMKKKKNERKGRDCATIE
jgi:hypothetical protein